MTATIKRRHFVTYKHEFNKQGIVSTHAIEEIKPTPKRVVNRVSRIPWGWINKEIYDPDVLPERIERQNMRLFDLLDHGKAVGYSIIVEPDQKIRNSFLKASKQQSLIEIENIALFPKQEGQGRGSSFLKLIMNRLFDDGHDLAYLNTSETNFSTLPQFYRSFGMIDLGQDEVADFNNRQHVQVFEVA